MLRKSDAAKLRVTPYGEAVLGTGHAHPAGGYRKFIQGSVRPDPPEDERG